MLQAESRSVSVTSSLHVLCISALAASGTVELLRAGSSLVINCMRRCDETTDAAGDLPARDHHHSSHVVLRLHLP